MLLVTVSFFLIAIVLEIIIVDVLDMTPTFIDSLPYKHFHSGPRRHYLNKHLRWKPLPDNREHTNRRFRFADRSRRSQRSLFKYYTPTRLQPQAFFEAFFNYSLGNPPQYLS